MNISVISPKRKIYEGEADMVTAPCLEGETTILPRHMDFVTPMTEGVVEIKKNSEVTIFSIGKGVLFVDKGKVTLLIEDAKYISELVEQEIIKAKDRAEEIIAKGDKDQSLQARYLLRRSLVDLKMLRRRKKSHV